MAERILDTNYLVNHWRDSRPGPLRSYTRSDAESWGQKLIELQDTNAIVSPIYLEVVGGTVDGHEMDLTTAYLNPFEVLDKFLITPDDWKEARRLVERIPFGSNPPRRGLVDCLIKALATRFRYTVLTCDKRMPRRKDEKRN